MDRIRAQDHHLLKYPMKHKGKKRNQNWSRTQEKGRDGMMRARTMPACCASMLCLILLLLCGLLGGWVLSICPSVCFCSQGHRAVDCSSRGLTKLPPGLQHNIHFLNLSFNSLQGLDSQLSQYAHLRTLDLSYNRLESLPPALPRSLWDIRAVGNHLRSLEKNDTAYHWNLKVLDLSGNELERVVFINNTMPSLQALNLSHNRFWTVPTNMPHNLERIDLSHNFLVQILPGSLDRLPRLVNFYLHANRFSWLSKGIFDKLTRLEVMTLGDNPWACEEEENITRLLRWTEHTRATVLGCPCYTRPICGQSHLATPGKEWHSALLTEPPLWVNSKGAGHEGKLRTRTPGVTSSYQVKSSHFETGMYQDKIEVNESREHVAFVWTSTRFDGFSTHTSTTVEPLSSTTKSKVVNSRSKCQTLQSHKTVTLAILILTFNI